VSMSAVSQRVDDITDTVLSKNTVVVAPSTVVRSSGGSWHAVHCIQQRESFTALA